MESSMLTESLEPDSKLGMGQKCLTAPAWLHTLTPPVEVSTEEVVLRRRGGLRARDATVPHRSLCLM